MNNKELIRKAFKDMAWAIEQYQNYAKESELGLELEILKLEKEIKEIKENNNV